MKTTTASIIAMTALFVSAVAVQAQTSRGQTDLALASLEELLNLKITSASRKEQSVENTPAAVYVITQSDIRRSGTHLLPELFRLVPGMEVAQIGASDWAISIRGFNSRYSDKVLVLVDGRSIYNGAFSGVVWSAQDMMIDDIERIEVIRGPGGAVWGADAVNGVINIITKSADATQGALLRLGAGTFDGNQGAARYGGRLGNMSYRVYSQWSRHGTANGAAATTSADDAWHSNASGARVDVVKDANSFLAEADFLQSTANPLPPDPSAYAAKNLSRASILGRWTHTNAADGVLQVQSYATFNSDVVRGQAEHSTENISDIDLQYHQAVGRHDLVMGGEYRWSQNQIAPSGRVTVFPESWRGAIGSVFGQDEIHLTDRVRVVVGSKIEHDSRTEWDVQPTARLLWDTGHHDGRVWFAASRATKTPALYDMGLRIRVPLPPLNDGTPLEMRIFGNPDNKTLTLTDVEAGYRVNVGPRVSIDATAFKGSYDRLLSYHPSTPRFELSPTPTVVLEQHISNGLSATTEGFEVASHARPFGGVALDGWYSYLKIRQTLDPQSGDGLVAALFDVSPTFQWHVHAGLPITGAVSLDASLAHAGRVDPLSIPAYTRADLRLQMKIRRQLQLAVVGQNLLQDSHLEADAIGAGLGQTRVPRSAGVQVSWESR